MAEGLEIEAAARIVDERDLLAPARRLIGLEQLIEQRIVGTGDGLAVRGLVEAADARLEEIVGAAEIAALADGPHHGRGVERQHLLDLVEQLKRFARLAVELVDEGDDGDVAQAADLKQLARARLDALGGVDDHDGGVDGGQRAVGVVGEVLVARRVEQVQDRAAIFERHHRGGNRDAALALDRHPVGPRPALVLLGLDLAGELDGAAEQQQLLGQRRLAGVGVGDDGEGAPALDLARERAAAPLAGLCAVRWCAFRQRRRCRPAWSSGFCSINGMLRPQELAVWGAKYKGDRRTATCR